MTENNQKTGKIANIVIYTVVGLIVVFLLLKFVGPKFNIDIFGKGKNDNDIEYSRVKGFPRTIGTSEQLAKTRVVIKSEEELKQALATVDKNGEIELPQINFDKKIALLASSKTRNTGGYEIRIRKIEQDKDDLIVNIRETSPGKTCITTQQMNVPVELVVIDKTDLSVEFNTYQEEKQCN